MWNGFGILPDSFLFIFQNTLLARPYRRFLLALPLKCMGKTDASEKLKSKSITCKYIFSRLKKNGLKSDIFLQGC